MRKIWLDKHLDFFRCSVALSLILFLIGISHSANGASPAIFQKSCSPCHGLYGGGEGTLGDILELKNLNLKSIDGIKTKLAAINGNNVLKLNTKVSHFTKKLSQAEIRSIVSFIRKFKHKNVIINNTLYKTACINCHGYRGDGNPTFVGLIGKAKDFRSKVIQGLKYKSLLKVIQKSAQKKIRLKSNIKHYPRALTKVEINNIIGFLAQ